jgi:hypothetical protein
MKWTEFVMAVGFMFSGTDNFFMPLYTFLMNTVEPGPLAEMLQMGFLLLGIGLFLHWTYKQLAKK